MEKCASQYLALQGSLPEKGQGRLRGLLPCAVLQVSVLVMVEVIIAHRHTGNLRLYRPSSPIPLLLSWLRYNSCMKILVLAPQWPDPPRQGAAIRNLPILLYLARRHDVYLLTFATGGDMQRQRLEQAGKRAEALPPPERSAAERLSQLATSTLPDIAWRLHSDAMQRRVERLSGEVPFDAIHVEGLEMAPYALHVLRMQRLHPEGRMRLIYDAHNAEYMLQRRAFKTDSGHPNRLPKAFYSLVQWRRLRAFEQQVCRVSNVVLAVSERDKAALSRLVPEKPGAVRRLPNGVDPVYWARDADYPTVSLPAGVDTLVFDGTMDFRPNVDAVLWFVNRVWPLIRAARPNVHFYIVGRNPTPLVLALSTRPGVTVTGAVEDTRGWVAGATVYVVPMRMGGGVRLKVLQAMAMGCAIVSTPMGADGISVRPGADMLLARSPQDFAASTVSLLSDARLRARLGGAARERVEALYDWDKLLPTLDLVYPGASSQRARVQSPATRQRITAPLPALETYLHEVSSAGQEAATPDDLTSPPAHEDEALDTDAAQGAERSAETPARSVLGAAETEADPLEQFRADARQSALFEHRLQNWSRFVLSVEKGYGSTIFEYSKSLETRDLIADLLSELPETVVHGLIPLLQPWDTRFMLSTQKVHKPVLGRVNEEGTGLWWYRVPGVLKSKDYPRMTFWLRDYPYTRVSSDTWQVHDAG